MITYIIILVLYLLAVIIAISFDQKALLGIAGIAFLYPLMHEDNTVITILSVVMMLFHFVIAFFGNRGQDEDFD